MAIANFQAASNVALDAIQGDFLVANPSLDDDDVMKEDNQVLTLAYVLVKVLRARQNSALAKDRVFGTFVGPHAAMAFMRLASMINEVYDEFYAAAGNVDEIGDLVCTAGFGEDGPKGGPTH